MRYYVEAYREDVARGGYTQVLGNLDGQRAWEGKDYKRTRWYRALPFRRTLGDRVRFWLICNDKGETLERVEAKAGAL